VQLRNRAYDRGRFRTFWVGVPVISVGNLTLGGTGKTPLVAWLANWYSRQGVRAAILSRGYGAMAGGVNDEARELDLYVPGVLHLQHPDRVLAARQAIEHRKAELIILDDGFQHRRLHRDLDIVLLDGLLPFGFGHVFPRGMLREPVSELRRADVVVLSRANYVGADVREEIFQEVRRYAPHALWAEVAYSPRHLLNASGKTEPLTSFRRQPVAAFCGIGNPTAFRLTLEECGYRVIAFREFPDHYAYREEDLRRLAQWANSFDVKAVLCTQKDLVKIPREMLGDRPLWAVVTGVDFLRGQEALEERLRALKPPVTEP
jgi:tetraacyldisaccharide 4'-kinase